MDVKYRGSKVGEDGILKNSQSTSQPQLASRLEGLVDSEKKIYDRFREKVKKSLDSKIPPKYQKASELLLLLPDFIVLIFRLLKDARVPTGAKARLILYTAYLISPVDIVPDFVPVLGQFDDLFAAAYVLQSILSVTPEEVVREHWSGQGEVLKNIQIVLDVAVEVFGSSLLNKLFKHFKKK